MKSTITVNKQSTQEVEVTLPFYSKIESGIITEYFAIKSTLLSDTENIYMMFKDGSLYIYRELSDINDAVKGEQISESEYLAVVKNATKNLAEKYNGSYYMTDQEKEDYGSTAGESVHDGNFEEFKKEN